MFLSEENSQLKAKGSNMPFAEISKAISAKWKSLSQSEKDVSSYIHFEYNREYHSNFT